MDFSICFKLDRKRQNNCLLFLFKIACTLNPTQTIGQEDGQVDYDYVGDDENVWKYLKAMKKYEKIWSNT